MMAVIPSHHYVRLKYITLLCLHHHVFFSFQVFFFQEHIIVSLPNIVLHILLSLQILTYRTVSLNVTYDVIVTYISLKECFVKCKLNVNPVRKESPMHILYSLCHLSNNLQYCTVMLIVCCSFTFIFLLVPTPVCCNY